MIFYSTKYVDVLITTADEECKFALGMGVNCHAVRTARVLPAR